MTLITWTVVGLINQAGDELYVAGVFRGMQRNCDTNIDAEVQGETMDQFVGFFDADDADAAAEIARDMIKNPIVAASTTGRTLERPVVDAEVRSNLL
jgi:hypothetical protein